MELLGRACCYEPSVAPAHSLQDGRLFPQIRPSSSISEHESNKSVHVAIKRHMCTFSEVLFKVIKTWKRPRWPPTVEWIDKPVRPLPHGPPLAAQGTNGGVPTAGKMLTDTTPRERSWTFVKKHTQSLP